MTDDDEGDRWLKTFLVWDPWSHLQTEKEEVQQMHMVEQLLRNEVPEDAKHKKSKGGGQP